MADASDFLRYEMTMLALIDRLDAATVSLNAINNTDPSVLRSDSEGPNLIVHKIGILNTEINKYNAIMTGKNSDTTVAEYFKEEEHGS